MKKLLSAITCVILALVMLTGCSQPVFRLSGSYFLDDETNLSVGQIDETSTYNVEFLPNEQSAVQLKVDTAKYTTHLFTSSYEGTKCYQYTTTLDVTGSYTIAGNSEAFTDKVETEVYFLGVDKSLNPLYSKRTVKAHSAVATTEEYSVKYYEYEIATKYQDSNATVTFTPNTEQSTGAYDLTAGEHNFTKVYEKPYFDNEMMLIAMRAMDLNASYSATFTTIDAFSNAKREMQLLPDSETPSETLEISYTNSGEKVSKVETFKYDLSIAGTFTGSTIVLNYAARTQKKEGQRLVKMEVEAPLTMGKFVYTINSVSKK